MATGWAGDGAVQDQIDATVKDAIKRARSQLPSGPRRFAGSLRPLSLIADDEARHGRASRPA